MSTLSPPPHHQASVEHAAMDDAPGASLVTVVHKQLAALEALIAEGHAEATLLHADIAELSNQLNASCTRLAKLETTMANTERVLGAIRGGLLVLPSRQPEPSQPVAQHQQPAGNGVRQEVVEAATPTSVQAAPSQVLSPVAVPASQPVSSPPVERAVPPAAVAPTSQPAPTPATEARVSSATTTAALPVDQASNGPDQARPASIPQRESDRGPASPPPATSASAPVVAAPALTPSVAPAPQPAAPRAAPPATPAVVPPATVRPPAQTASAAVSNTPSRTNVPAQPAANVSRAAATAQSTVTAAPPAQAASTSGPSAQARVNAPAPQERPNTAASPAPADSGPRVQRGSTVEVVFDNEGTETYTIVRRDEASATRNLISENSPLGQALLGATVGDVVRYRVGNGPELVVRVGAIA